MPRGTCWKGYQQKGMKKKGNKVFKIKPCVCGHECECKKEKK
jgi:hypothetical protein